MVGIQYERGVVAEMYPTPSWRRRVDKMPDAQVHAIYIKYIQTQEAKKEEDPESKELPF